MKKNIVKILLATAFAATVFIGSSKMEAKAVTPEQFTDMETISNTASVPASKSFDYKRYAAENPDVAAVFGQDEKALYNHYAACGVKEGRKAYYTDGTLIVKAAEDVHVVAGTVYSDYEMLDLVNADREANGAPALVWDEELEQIARERAVVCMANYQSGLSGHAGAVEISGGENLYYFPGSYVSANGVDSNFVNAGWIASESHHAGRIYADVVTYAAAAYMDPATGDVVWIEVFDY